MRPTASGLFSSCEQGLWMRTRMLRHLSQILEVCEKDSVPSLHFLLACRQLSGIGCNLSAGVAASGGALSSALQCHLHSASWCGLARRGFSQCQGSSEKSGLTQQLQIWGEGEELAIFKGIVLSFSWVSGSSAGEFYHDFSWRSLFFEAVTLLQMCPKSQRILQLGSLLGEVFLTCPAEDSWCVKLLLLQDTCVEPAGVLTARSLLSGTCLEIWLEREIVQCFL